jgi:hypothetical protein
MENKIKSLVEIKFFLTINLITAKKKIQVLEVVKFKERRCEKRVTVLTLKDLKSF